MANFNRIIMAGNLTRDPEFKQFNGGQNLCKLGLAINRQFRNRQTGAMVQEVCFIDVEVWGPQADSCRQYLQKGRGVLVEGRLKLDTWEDAQGQKRSKHVIVADSVVFLGNGNGSGSAFAETMEENQSTELKDKAVLEQLEMLKSKQSTTTTTKTVGARKLASTDDEIAFQDEPPFTKELPF